MQQELATRLEGSRQAVNADETGTHDPALPLPFEIAQTFGRTAEGGVRSGRVGREPKAGCEMATVAP